MTREMQFLFDLLKLPRLNLAGSISLAHALVALRPKEPTAAVQKAADALSQCTATFQQQWGDRLRADAASSDVVAHDRAIDAAWGAMQDRLSSYAWLPAERYPLAARAAEFQKTLFPDGRSFFQLPFEQEWAHSDTLLKRIDGEGMAADLEKITGPEILAELRDAHRRYGVALGKSGPVADETKINMLESLRQLTDAIRAYALQVVASADAGQPASVAAARAALQPIADARSQLARRRSPQAAQPTQPAPAPEPADI